MDAELNAYALRLCSLMNKIINRHDNRTIKFIKFIFLFKII